MIILESGSVAKDRILKDDIVGTFNKIQEIVGFLKENNLIKKDPQFRLGSTKIAYRIFQKKLNKLVDNIDDEDWNKAELKRLEDGFGDMDIDLVLSDGVTLDDIENKLVSQFGDSIWKVAPKGERAPGQLHFGFKIGDKVHQVDFVEILGKSDQEIEDFYKIKDYFSGTSATDEAHGIKGLFNKEMHYALTNLIDPDEIINTFAKRDGKTFEDKAQEYNQVEARELELYKQEIKQEKITKNYVVEFEGKKYPVLGASKGKIKLGKEIIDADNVDLTPTQDVDASNASFVVEKRRKVSLFESKLQDKYGITYRVYFYRQKIKESEGKIKVSVESVPKKVILDYVPLSQQDTVIKILLGDKATTKELFSAVETAKFIGKNFPDDKKIEFWEMFVDQAVEKRQKIRIDRKTGQPVIDPETGKQEVTGQVSPAKYDESMRVLGKLIGIDKILGQDFTVLPKEEKEIDEQTALNETYQKMVFDEAESIRTGIKRFDTPNASNKVSGEDFLKALKAIYPYVKEDGILHANAAPNVDVVEKVDSSFCHFGINKQGKFFLSSSNSGEVTAENAEFKFKNNQDFLESFKVLNENKLLHVVLKNISKQINKPVKFEAEILPMLTHTPDETGNVTFIGTPYSQQKVGEKGAFVVFKAQVFEGDEWSRPSSSEQKKLISEILDADSKEWHIFSNDVHMKLSQDIDFGVDFKQLDAYLGSDAGFKKLLDLMEAKITPEKKRVKEILADIRVKMQQAIDNVANNTISQLGNNYIEGIILRIKEDNGNVMEIKGTSEKFSENKKKLWKYRDELENLFDNFKEEIKTKILNLKITTDRSINQKFVDTAQSFKPTAQTKEGAIQEFLVTVINQLIDPNSDFSNVRKVAGSVVKETKHKLAELKNDFKVNIESFDINSARKTKESFAIYEQKIMHLIEILISEHSDDLQYVLGCFKEIYEGKAKSLLETLEPSKEVQTKKCIIWLGRAQPWHKGHDEMVKIGLSKADHVYIIIVKGEMSSKDENKNPLSAETQKELIRSLYPGDSVIVSDNHPSKVSLPFIMMDLYSKGLEAIGWLVGEDRKDSYKGEIARFNFTQWAEGHTYAPIKPSIEFIVTPRLASATDAREMARNAPFEEWLKAFAPSELSNSGKTLYKKAYEEIRGSLDEVYRETINEMFKKTHPIK
jgi:hypothetical protein